MLQRYLSSFHDNLTCRIGISIVVGFLLQAAMNERCGDEVDVRRVFYDYFAECEIGV